MISDHVSYSEEGFPFPLRKLTTDSTHSTNLTISEDSRKEYHKVWLQHPFHQGKFLSCDGSSH